MKYYLRKKWHGATLCCVVARLETKAIGKINHVIIDRTHMTGVLFQFSLFSQVAIQAVLASVRMQLRMRKLKPLTFRDALRNPYAVKFLRQFIDASAFRIYGHWVKKATDQNRAALFENTSRANQQRMLEIEEKSSLLTLSNGELLNGLSTERNLVSPMVH